MLLVESVDLCEYSSYTPRAKRTGKVAAIKIDIVVQNVVLRLHQELSFAFVITCVFVHLLSNEAITAVENLALL